LGFSGGIRPKGLVRKEVKHLVETSQERRTIDFRDHWLRVIFIILLVGALDGFMGAVLFPSRDEIREVYEITLRSGGGGMKYMTIAAAARYLQLLVVIRHFILDTILLTPAVVLRFLFVRRPFFRLNGFLLAGIVITAIFCIFLFSRGFEAIGKNLRIFFVIWGFYGILSSRRKR
jgi:hypothetical protein